MILLGCLALLMFVLLLLAWTSPGTVEEKIPFYTYSHKAEVDYRVLLNRNPITEEESLGKGQFYLTPFVRNINTYFNYRFSGDRDVDIQGEYEVIAYMQGIQRELDKIKIIWSKPYRLLSKQTFQVKDKGISLNKEIPINIKNYNDFISMFFEDYKIPTEAILVVCWDVKVKALTAQGEVNEQLTPSMTIPLNTKFFEITGDLEKTKEGVLEATITKPASVNKAKAISFGVLEVISLSGLALLRFRTTIRVVDPVQKQFRKILKNHGERLVALDKEIIVGWESLLPVKAFDDLIRIADELGKPVMYKYNPEEDPVPVFYVLNDPRIFTCRLAVSEENTLDKGSGNKEVRPVKETNLPERGLADR